MSDTQAIVRTFSGQVVSDKMDKTITVLIESKVKHPLYGKYIKRSKKIHVHDETNEASMGDTVTITSVRPYSKTKTFKLVEVVTRSTEI